MRVTIVNVSSYEVPHRPSRTGHHTSYPIGNVRVSIGYVRVTIGNVSATIGNLHATTGNERVTIDNARFATSNMPLNSVPHFIILHNSLKTMSQVILVYIQ